MRFPVTNRRLAVLKSVGVYRSLEWLPSMLVPASAAHGAACRRCERHMYAVQHRLFTSAGEIVKDPSRRVECMHDAALNSCNSQCYW